MKTMRFVVVLPASILLVMAGCSKNSQQPAANSAPNVVQAGPAAVPAPVPAPKPTTINGQRMGESFGEFERTAVAHWQNTCATLQHDTAAWHNSCTPGMVLDISQELRTAAAGESNQGEKGGMTVIEFGGDEFSYNFQDKKLVYVNEFSIPTFDAAMAYAVENYGQPTDSLVFLQANDSGAPWVERDAVWRMPDGYSVMVEAGPKPDAQIVVGRNASMPHIPCENLLSHDAPILLSEKHANP